MSPTPSDALGGAANLPHVFLEAGVLNSFSALGLHPSNLPVWCFIASMLFQGLELVEAARIVPLSNHLPVYLSKIQTL